MKRRTSNHVSMDEIKTYLSPKIWKVKESDKKIEAKSGFFIFKVEEKEIVYGVKVWASDDESDSKEGETSNPVNFIRSFIGFEPDLSRQSSIMKRISFKIAFDKKKIEQGELEKIKKDMMSHRWDVEENVGGNGLPNLHILIGDEYEAEVRIEKKNYKCEFEIDGEINKKVESTDDPIKEFRKFYKDDKVSEIVDRVRKEKIETGDTIMEDTQGVVPQHRLEKTVRL